MNAYQKAAAWAAVTALFAGCSAGNPSDGEKKAASPPPPTAPTPAPPAPTVTSPSITAQPVGATLLTGATTTLTVTATGSLPTYQWKKNGTAISGATSASYTTPPATYQDDGASYTVVVSNSAGSATSTAATVHLSLSPDQAAYEGFALAGIYESSWNLNYSGGQTSGTDYLDYDYAVLSKSPLTNGPQTGPQQAPVNLTTSLALPAGGVTRVLKNGVILVVPDLQATYTSSYLGSAIQIDYLAADNTTVAFSRKRYNYAVTTMSGLLHLAPLEFRNAYNSIFVNPGVLNTTTTWAAGSAYVSFKQSALGDRYDVFDCHAATTGNSPSPCQTGTTLTAAMTAGETSTSDATTYHTADGKMANIGGVNIWVASQPRPVSSVGAYTVEYRLYFELNGNVYTGSLIKDGTVEGTMRYRTNPSDSTTTTYLDYQVRLNQAAMQSLAAGSLL